MTKFTEHPTDDQLLAFLRGEKADRRDIESHIVACKDCSDLLLSIEQAELFAKVSPEQRDQVQHQRQLAIIKRVVFEQAKVDRNIAKVKEGKSGNKSSTSQWGALGAVGGLVAGGMLGIPQPSLGGHEEENDDLTTSDSPTGDQSRESPSSDLEDFSPLDVIEHREDLSMDLNEGHDNEWESDGDPQDYTSGLDNNVDQPDGPAFDDDHDLDDFEGA